MTGSELFNLPFLSPPELTFFANTALDANITCNKIRVNLTILNQYLWNAVFSENIVKSIFVEIQQYFFNNHGYVRRLTYSIN